MMMKMANYGVVARKKYSNLNSSELCVCMWRTYFGNTKSNPPHTLRQNGTNPHNPHNFMVYHFCENNKIDQNIRT